MLVTTSKDTLSVLGYGGRLVHKSFDVIDYFKPSETSLVVVTKESIDYVQELEINGRTDIVSVKDTDFKKVLLESDLMVVERKIGFPVIDVYDSKFNNLLRLFKNFKGEWVYIITEFGVPTKFIKPTHFKEPNLLHGFRGNKEVFVNLKNQKVYNGKSKHGLGIDLAPILDKFY